MIYEMTVRETILLSHRHLTYKYLTYKGGSTTMPESRRERGC